MTAQHRQAGALRPRQLAGVVPVGRDRVAAGDWTPRVLPALTAAQEGAEPLRALNDLVLVRAGAGQVMVEIEVDGDTTRDRRV